MKLHPLKFNPIFKERIWGGNKLQTMCVKGNVSFQTENYQETLSFGETLLLPASIKNATVIANEASELLEVYIK